MPRRPQIHPQTLSHVSQSRSSHPRRPGIAVLKTSSTVAREGPLHKSPGRADLRPGSSRTPRQIASAPCLQPETPVRARGGDSLELGPHLRCAGSAQGDREHATQSSMRPVLATRSNPASSRVAAAAPTGSLPVSDTTGHARPAGDDIDDSLAQLPGLGLRHDA